MRIHGLLLIAGCSLLTAACSVMPRQVYYNRGDPENLLDMSEEVTHLSLGSSTSLAELFNVIRQDPPTRAELHCQPNEVLCVQAKSLFDHHGIPTQYAAGSGAGSVTLVYQRVVARDCENRYIDNSINPYNLPPPTFGCSVTANSVQMVSDKRQFVNPSLLDYPDSEKSVQNYESYLKPSASATFGGSPMQIYPAAVAPQ